MLLRPLCALCELMPHTRLSVEVTIGAVWTNRILPDDTCQIGTGQIDVGQIGTMEVGAG